MVTLREALESGRLPEFIAQAEADGIGPGDKAEFARPRGGRGHPFDYSAPTSRSNIAFSRSRWFARKVNSLR
jgi:hypothetical protein